MIIDYLDQLMGEGTYHNTSKGAQYSYKCPMCNDYKERLFVNIDKQVFKCHNCDSAGSIVTLISDANHITWKDALKVFRDFEGYAIALPTSIEEEVYQRLIQAPEIEVHKTVHPLPDEFILIEDAKGKAGREAIKYLRGRGVTLRMAEKYYIGYCAEGQYANRIIMPDFEDGELVYWQARTWEAPPKSKIAKKYFRKSLNPPPIEGVTTVGKSDVVSNIDFIKENGIAVICEGKFDSYAIGDSGACIHGKSMSDEQFIKLVRNKDKIDLVVVMLDGDALPNAITVADRLYRHFDDVLISRLPKDGDPSSLGSKRIAEILEKDSLPYSPMFGAKAKLRGWI